MAGTSAEHALPSSQSSTLFRMGERIAALEANQGSLKGDTESIRSSIHAINQDFQKILIVVERCTSAVQTVGGEIAKLHAAAPLVEREISAFESMRGDLRQMIEEHYRQDGQRRHRDGILEALRFVLPWLIAVAGAGFYIWEHLHMTGP